MRNKLVFKVIFAIEAACIRVIFVQAKKQNL